MVELFYQKSERRLFFIIILLLYKRTLGLHCITLQSSGNNYTRIIMGCRYRTHGLIFYRQRRNIKVIYNISNVSILVLEHLVFEKTKIGGKMSELAQFSVR